MNKPPGVGGAASVTSRAANEARLLPFQLNQLADNDHSTEEARAEVTRSAGGASVRALRRTDMSHDFLVHLKRAARPRHMQFRARTPDDGPCYFA